MRTCDDIMRDFKGRLERQIAKLREEARNLEDSCKNLSDHHAVESHVFWLTEEADTLEQILKESRDNTV